MAVTSGGAAISCVLRSLGAGPDMPVMTNAFTLAPVPGAIASVSAQAVLVDITDDLLIDFSDLREKARRSGSRILLLSHMRGRICDMEGLTGLCGEIGLHLVEDCAHTLGARWNGIWSGRHGVAACYSTQSYKHLNSGEGGIIISDNEQLMASATVISGSYMFFDRHESVPPPSEFSMARRMQPNCSMRMDEIRAAILRPQLLDLETRCAEWTRRYRIIEQELRNCRHLGLFERHPKEQFVGSSILFSLKNAVSHQLDSFLKSCGNRGIALAWFGAPEPSGYTSRHNSWQFIGQQDCPTADRLLARLFDMRIPLAFTTADCLAVGQIVAECADHAMSDLAP